MEIEGRNNINAGQGSAQMAAPAGVYHANHLAAALGGVFL
jgi:hypothetical protein